MAVTAENRYLTRVEMEGNAEYIWAVFNMHGWTMNAVAAMLGNMESESTINPGIYEDLDDTSTTNGFGLVQWTPNTKYKDWADAEGVNRYEDIAAQCARIQFELENGIQWIPTTQYPLTFEEFSKSERSPEYLAQAFLYNYERPAELNQPNRSAQALEWFAFLSGSEPPITPTRKNQMSKLLLYFAGTRR